MQKKCLFGICLVGGRFLQFFSVLKSVDYYSIQLRHISHKVITLEENGTQLQISRPYVELTCFKVFLVNMSNVRCK